LVDIPNKTVASTVDLLIDRYSPHNGSRNTQDEFTDEWSSDTREENDIELEELGVDKSLSEITRADESKQFEHVRRFTVRGSSDSEAQTGTYTSEDSTRGTSSYSDVRRESDDLPDTPAKDYSRDRTNDSDHTDDSKGSGDAIRNAKNLIRDQDMDMDSDSEGDLANNEMLRIMTDEVDR